jgi:hypothetical protein
MDALHSSAKNAFERPVESPVEQIQEDKEMSDETKDEICSTQRCSLDEAYAGIPFQIGADPRIGKVKAA